MRDGLIHVSSLIVTGVMIVRGQLVPYPAVPFARGCNQHAVRQLANFTYNFLCSRLIVIIRDDDVVLQDFLDVFSNRILTGLVSSSNANIAPRDQRVE